jgi:hypothetical protein
VLLLLLLLLLLVEARVVLHVLLLLLREVWVRRHERRPRWRRRDVGRMDLLRVLHVVVGRLWRQEVLWGQLLVLPGLLPGACVLCMLCLFLLVCCLCLAQQEERLGQVVALGGVPDGCKEGWGLD